MRQRVLAGGVPAGSHISTFHSLCVRILRKYGQPAGIVPTFSIYDESDQTRCMKEAITACQISSSNFSPARMLYFISRLKNDLEDEKSFAGRADDFFGKTGFKKTYECTRLSKEDIAKIINYENDIDNRDSNK